MGKAEPVAIYEVLGEKGALAPDIEKAMTSFHEGLLCYRRREWEQAIEHFRAVIELKPDDPPALEFIKRCEEFKNAPKIAHRAEDKAKMLPDDWDGVYQMTSK